MTLKQFFYNLVKIRLVSIFLIFRCNLVAALACIKKNYPHFIGCTSNNIDCAVVPRNREGKWFCGDVEFPVGHIFQTKSSMLTKCS